MKNELRAQILQMRKLVAKPVLTLMATRAQEHLLQWPGLARAARPALYMPIRREPATMDLVVSLLAHKPVLLPKITAPGRMEFISCSDMDTLVSGPFDLREPPPGPAAVPDLIIAPGLAFDTAGHRLGYGGGYYDRYLATMDPCPVIGLCYGFEILEHVPAYEHDQKVNALCWEGGLAWL